MDAIHRYHEPRPHGSRVQILVSAVRKHMLPIEESCGWYHRRGVTTPTDTVCLKLNGKPVKDRADLWKCVEDNDCMFNDKRLQLAVLRDPRAITVSAYFQLIKQKSPRTTDRNLFKSVDHFFQAELSHVCMWVSIRYFLFTQLLSDRSAVFWYDEAVDDPYDWHGRYFAFVGLHLPIEEVATAAHTASRGGSIMGFPSKGIDEHPGGKAQSVARTFRDELNNISLSVMDDVLKQWLPPVVLRRFGLDY